MERENDWVNETTDRIESIVETVRSKTTVPATTAARAVVFGMVAATLLVAFMILMVIMTMRLLDVYLPFIHPRARRVWIVDGIFSAIFLAVGMFIWRKRHPKSA